MEKAASEELEGQVRSVSTSVRGFVLAKEKKEEFDLSLHREQVLDLYLHFVEFKSEATDPAVIETVIRVMRNFLVEANQ